MASCSTHTATSSIRMFANEQRNLLLHTIHQPSYSVSVDDDPSKESRQVSYPTRTYEDAFDPGSMLCLDGQITVLGRWAVAAGGHADIWQGSFGHRTVAIKVARLFSGTGKRLQQSKLRRRIWREYLAWSSLSHPNVLECLGFTYDFAPDSYVLPSLISPWMSNGTLPSYLEKHPDADRLALLAGIADGLSYLHTRRPAIVHGDVRGSNILVSDSGVPCFGDFGLSRILSEAKGMSTTSEPGGSLRWMSPELLHDGGRASVKSDTWAYGMTVLETLSGSSPYREVKSDILVFGRIKDGEIPSRPEDSLGSQLLSNEMWSLCRRTWSLEPIRRPSMSDVASKLQAYRNNDFEDVLHPVGLGSSPSTCRSYGDGIEGFRIVRFTTAFLGELTQF